MDKTPVFRFWLRIAVISAILMIFACAAPYKLFPEYEQQQRAIHRIALYPLIYTDDGRYQRLFGLTFHEQFYDYIAATRCIRAIHFIPPDSTVSLFREAGLDVVSFLTGVVDENDLETEYADYAPLIADEVRLISDRADAILFCDLTEYIELSPGEELGLAVASFFITGCLTGESSSSEENEIRMTMSLVSTRTGSVLWTYHPHFTLSMSERETTRTDFTMKIASGFRKYFPLSIEFEAE
ncbi:hypothetical protein JXO59_11895 [candidate division KSB1 bacterium]|nr:hypothetical protein [candidate division KSB1 bacterium]